jgi:EamA domain-containing membrane protein RarD
MNYSEKADNLVILLFLTSIVSGHGLGFVSGVLYGSRYSDVVNQLFGWFPMLEFSWSGSTLEVGLIVTMSYISGIIVLVASINLANELFDFHGDDE